MNAHEKPKNGLLIVISVVVIALVLPTLVSLFLWPLLLGLGLFGT